MEQITIELVRSKIQRHLDNGGSLYDPIDELDYYEQLRGLRDTLKKENPDITLDEVYIVFGFPFDREYHAFSKLVEDIATYSDNENFVDGLKQNPVVKGKLKEFIKKYKFGCSPADFLILMTDYRYRNCMIATSSYEGQLRENLAQTNPHADVIDLRGSTELEQLKHLARYHGISIKEAAKMVGLPDKYSETTEIVVRSHLKSEELAEEFRGLYGTELHDSLAHVNPTLYFKITRDAARNNLTLDEWLESFGLKIIRETKKGSVKRHSAVKKLSKIKVDSRVREDQLRSISDEIIEAEGIEFTGDPIADYHVRKNLAIATMARVQADEAEKFSDLIENPSDDGM